MSRRVVALLVVLGALLVLAAQCPMTDPGLPSDPDPGQTPGSMLFFDDFEGGPDASWGFASGTWFEEEGKLSVGFSFEVCSAYVNGGEGWTDYEASVVVNYDTTGTGSRAGVICRAQDDLNKVIFWAYRDRVFFTVYEAGEVTQEEAAVSQGALPREQDCTMSVRVSGDSYRGYVNGVLRSELTYGGIGSGTAGIAGAYINERTTFDDFHVVELE